MPKIRELKIYTDATAIRRRGKASPWSVGMGAVIKKDGVQSTDFERSTVRVDEKSQAVAAAEIMAAHFMLEKYALDKDQPTAEQLYYYTDNLFVAGLLKGIALEDLPLPQNPILHDNFERSRTNPIVQEKAKTLFALGEKLRAAYGGKNFVPAMRTRNEQPEMSLADEMAMKALPQKKGDRSLAFVTQPKKPLKSGPDGGSDPSP